MIKHTEETWRKVKERRRPIATLNRARDFFEGDHWRKGEEWVGPWPTEDGEKENAWITKEIEKSFTSRNLIREVVTRHVDSILGKEPRWNYVSGEVVTGVSEEDAADQTDLTTKKKDPRVAKVEAAVMHWWAERKITQKLLEASYQLVWAESSPLYIYTPPAVLAEDGSLKFSGSLEENLKNFYFQALPVTSAGVLVDQHGVEVGAFYEYEEDDISIEERVFLTEDNLTVIQKIKGGAKADVDYFEVLDSTTDIEVAVLDLGGKLPMHEMRILPFLIPSMFQNQNFYNMNKTMMSRNIVLAGFLERYFLNAQRPGEWVKGTDGKREFVPSPVKVGAGTMHYVGGEIETDERGKPTGKRSNVQVVFKDPIPVTTFTDTRADIEEDFYSEAKQRFVIMSGDATASGKSRIVAMQDFDASVRKTRRVIESAIEWLLETVLVWASLGGTGDLATADLSATVECQLSTTIASVEESNLFMDMADRGYASRETVLVKLGHEDPDAEEEKIQQDMKNLISRLKTAANTPQPGALDVNDVDDVPPVDDAS